jgi:hypothetical protein
VTDADITASARLIDTHSVSEEKKIHEELRAEGKKEFNFLESSAK